MDASRLAVLFAAAGTATASALAIRAWIKRPIKQFQSHTEFKPLKGYESGRTVAHAGSFLPTRTNSTATESEPDQAFEETTNKALHTALEDAPVVTEALQKSAREMTFEYRKSSGESGERVVMAYSRNLVEGRTHSINCRQQGEHTTKLFLLSGIQSLTVVINAQSLTVKSPAEIEALLDELIPLKGEASTQQPNKAKAQSPSISAATGASISTAEATAIGNRMVPPPPPPPPLPSGFERVSQKDKTLADLLPAGAKGFAIFDLETTGKESGSCRIVEIGLITMDASGRVTEEWETLVNPGCSFDNHAIHGIDEAMVREAPTFAAIAPQLAARLDGSVLLAHNLNRFDGPILERHFREVASISIDLGDGIDTMPNPRRKLTSLCDQHGVGYDPNDCHTALGDVRALAALVPKLLQELSAAGKPVLCTSNPMLDRQHRPEVTRAKAVATAPPQVARTDVWSEVVITLQAGLVFVGTQNKAPSKLAVLQQAEDHLLAMGLRLMVKRARILASDRPAFVLAPSLDVTSTKMKDAIGLQVPVVLCADARQVQAGGTVKAWLKNG